MIDRRHNPNIPQPDGRRCTDVSMTVDDIAVEYGVGEDQVYKWLKAGVLRGHKLPGARGHWRIARADADAFRAQCAAAAAAAIR
jgi:excisionase family DNA binding protein